VEDDSGIGNDALLSPTTLGVTEVATGRRTLVRTDPYPSPFWSPNLTAVAWTRAVGNPVSGTEELVVVTMRRPAQQRRAP
jgi:hypothetical protein